MERVRKRLQVESKRKHAWFWSRSWQKAEREVDREVKAGRVRRVGSVGELLSQIKA